MPGGPSGAIQYNSGGAFAGDQDFLWIPASNSIRLTASADASIETPSQNGAIGTFHFRTGSSTGGGGDEYVRSKIEANA